MRLTAEQYSQCWKERVGKEEAVLYPPQKTKGESSAPPPADDDVQSVRSVRTARSGASTSYSEISSCVSSSSYAARKVELLNLQLEEETKKRKALEAKLAAAGVKL